MEANLNLLRSFGCSNNNIKPAVLRHPGILRPGTKKLEERLHRVEKEFGVSPDSPRFLQIVGVLSNMSQENVDTKFGIFKSFGWSDTNIFTMLQKQPECVSLSDSRIQTALTFLMKEVRYKSTYIASYPVLLAYSLEKRLIPRYAMWKLINKNNLTKSRHKFCTVMTWPESKFFEKYVLPIKAKLPELYDLYIKKKNAWLISYNSRAIMEANLNLLRSFVCSNDKIKHTVLRNPGILRSGTKKLEEMLYRVEKEFGVSPDSAGFLQIVSVLSNMSQENVDTKLGIFKSFGWSDTNIFTMLQKQPECIGLSGSRILTALTFLMKEVRYKSTYIASCPKLLAYSLEKRLIPSILAQ